MKVYIKTYGCQMNERDSEAMAGILVKAGHQMVSTETDADVLLFNTCSVRDQAERKAVGKIGFMKKLKKTKPSLIIGVAGCMAQARGESLFAELPHLDFVLGTGQLHRLAEVIDSVSKTRKNTALLEEGGEVLDGMGEHFSASAASPVSGYIAITRGCNRFCSYCIVPYVRGRELSRDARGIVAEARMLADSGIREIMLLGQNVAAYGMQGRTSAPEDHDSPFAELLEELCAIDGIKRIRFTSPYPTYFNERLIATLAREPKICRSLHLPVQSGSNRMLAAMNRQYTRERYLEIVAKLKAALPGAAFSTDVIVGFPGETQSDFEATRSLLEEVQFDQSYIFKYSPRSGTKSAALPDDVSDEVKLERNKILLDDLARRVQTALKNEVGETREVLVEGVSHRNAERWTGRTQTNRTVNFLPVEGIAVGQLRQIQITRAGSVSLFGKVVGE
ncbi:MAG: tRNA (N6-isopentenyl adenosine(37)-C2)-methylthiotransferase MiaB [Victivallaceae bacterium]|nr:tRNA (N6-isopentenyl adenosine(37)-C2)-methylthiotransferase MiaB [Victivallaceae bacterium]